MRIGSFDMIDTELTQTKDLDNLKQSIEKQSKTPINNKKVKEADSVAKEFETLFVDMMMKSMRQTVPKEDESNAENIYKSMLDSQYSKIMTDAQSFGIREMVKQWIIDSSEIKSD